MEEVGKVTYSRFEKDPKSDENTEVTDLILSLHRDTTNKYGLVYIPRDDAGPSDKICLAIEPVIPILSRLYQPFFNKYVHKDKTLVTRTIGEAIKNIYFEEHDLFNQKYKSLMGQYKQQIAGMHLYGDGSYIKIDNKISFEELHRVVMHETGHALHSLTHQYVHEDKSIMAYDTVMQEIMAISLAERTFKFVDYNKDPHKKAKEFINRLKTNDKFKKITFHQRWWEFLHYLDHKMFETEYVKKWEDGEDIILPLD